MSTTLANAEIALSKELGDYWAGTSTSAGAAGGTTVIDTALKAKANDWVSEEAYDMITSGTYDGEERKISSLDNTSGTLTVLAHTGQIASGITYRVHRLFSASDKRIALISAAKDAFPYIYNEIRDESLVLGNWLKDGSFEVWTNATTPTYWTVTTCTATKTSTAGLVRHGTYSCQLSTLAGTIAHKITNFTDLQFLRGRSVTFSIQAYSNTANALRISVYDGTTTTYSSYHAGDSAWTEDNPSNDNMYVTQYIDPNATEVTVTVHYVNAAATCYVDDARLISNPHGRIYIGNLGLAQNKPNEVLVERAYYSQDEPWITVRDWDVDSSGYLYIPTDYVSDRRLRIVGKGYLDFLASGASSTAWTATINIDDPQLKILSAQAALYLYTTMSLPNYESGTTKDYQAAMNYWVGKLAERQVKYGMGWGTTTATVNYGVH